MDQASLHAMGTTFGLLLSEKGYMFSDRIKAVN
jgi:hypothetical protein